MKMASKQFTIDDAFESDDDDRIRSYGTNVETRPLQNKKLRNVATVAVQMQEMSPTRKSSESEVGYGSMHLSKYSNSFHNSSQSRSSLYPKLIFVYHVCDGEKGQPVITAYGRALLTMPVRMSDAIPVC